MRNKAVMGNENMYIYRLDAAGVTFAHPESYTATTIIGVVPTVAPTAAGREHLRTGHVA